jgi:hypothetical protein
MAPYPALLLTFFFYGLDSWFRNKVGCLGTVTDFYLGWVNILSQHTKLAQFPRHLIHWDCPCLASSINSLSTLDNSLHDSFPLYLKVCYFISPITSFIAHIF